LRDYKDILTLEIVEEVKKITQMVNLIDVSKLHISPEYQND
jgi:hypothetical protein